MADEYVSDERSDIDKLISFLRFVNSKYIDIKGLRKDLKNVKKNHDEEKED